MALGLCKYNGALKPAMRTRRLAGEIVRIQPYTITHLRTFFGNFLN